MNRDQLSIPFVLVCAAALVGLFAAWLFYAPSSYTRYSPYIPAPTYTATYSPDMPPTSPPGATLQ